MVEQRIYLDWNASAPVLPAVERAVLSAMQFRGNPSSIHVEGRAARAVIDRAREAIAHATGGKAENVIFTSGGSEGAATLLQPDWAARGAVRHHTTLVLSATEHAAVLAGGRFDASACLRLPVDANGLVDPAALGEQFARIDTPLFAIQLANSETGVIQPVGALAETARRNGALVVCDAVQGLGKIPVNIGALGVDALFVSAHKIGGPKGVGAIVLADAATAPARALIAGGGQQRGFRGGTENVAGAAGFAAALEAIGDQAGSPELRNGFERALSAACPEAVFFGASAPRLANTSLFAIPGDRAETALIAYDLAGFAVSSGSACSSGKVKRSHVLDAMGVPPGLAEAAIRLSLGPSTLADEINRFAALVIDRAAHLNRRKMERAA
jgi:cysteine desulfurase